MNSIDFGRNLECEITEKLDGIIGRFKVSLKRGCSEFPLKIPTFGVVSSSADKMMSFPLEWKAIENRFDEEKTMEQPSNFIPSNRAFCLSDVLILLKWIDYAKGLGDPSVSSLLQRTITHTDTFETARSRKRAYEEVISKKLSLQD